MTVRVNEKQEPVTYFEKDGLWYTVGLGHSSVHSNRGAAYNAAKRENDAYFKGQAVQDIEIEKLISDAFEWAWVNRYRYRNYSGPGAPCAAAYKDYMSIKIMEEDMK